MDHPATSDVAHVALRLGRLMLANGADTGHVQEAVGAFAARRGYGAHLAVCSEGLLLTLENKQGFRTKLGPAIAGMAVNMGALAALADILRQDAVSGADVLAVDRQLDAVERSGNRYPHWLVMLGMGVTAASLARLFGGVWAVVSVSFLVGIATQFLRQSLGGSSVNPIAGAALAAFGGGLVGALVMKAFPDASPALCLVAAGMILVPGVPLLNGVRDTLGSHVGTGVSRLLLGTVTVLSIALGLFLAADLAGTMLPVEGSVPLLPIGEDFAFSALAGVGYALLFNVPARAAWACVVCAMTGHGLRTAFEHLGLDLTVSSLAGAFAAALLARLLARHFGVPPSTFAFPGVVAMIPGSYAFRAGIGGLAIMHAGADAPPALIGNTIGLAVTAILVTAAIAIGLSVALAAPLKNFTPAQSN
ncbi:threonine/serine exporter family protein [Rhizobium sp. BK251]|uniref:threonine/serine ThrE exporter family protein n=1 Tax=Rhizobium sp. BK251 TaxID=2512125 RepID=UPI001FDEB84C|nr:threonine/serine exporter family protein [Rhizobium sp. BK251]